MHRMQHIWTIVMLEICKHTFYAYLSRIWKMMQFTGLIRKVFATKILLSGKFLLFVTLLWSLSQVLNLPFRSIHCVSEIGRRVARDRQSELLPLHIVDHWRWGKGCCWHQPLLQHRWLIAVLGVIPWLMRILYSQKTRSSQGYKKMSLRSRPIMTWMQQPHAKSNQHSSEKRWLYSARLKYDCHYHLRFCLFISSTASSMPFFSSLLKVSEKLLKPSLLLFVTGFRTPWRRKVLKHPHKA